MFFLQAYQVLCIWAMLIRVRFLSLGHGSKNHPYQPCRPRILKVVEIDSWDPSSKVIRATKSSSCISNTAGVSTRISEKRVPTDTTSTSAALKSSLLNQMQSVDQKMITCVISAMSVEAGTIHRFQRIRARRCRNWLKATARHRTH